MLEDAFRKIDEIPHIYIRRAELKEILTAFAKKEEEKVISSSELLNSFDASIWAKEFMRVYNNKILAPQNHEDAHWIDEDLMRAWFANAIMAGYDHANRNYPDTVRLQKIRERARALRDIHTGNFAQCWNKILDLIKDIAEGRE